MRKKQGIRQRKNGLWEYRLNTPQGLKSVYGHSPKECEAKAEIIKQKLAEGLKIEASKLTFEEYSQEWLNGVSGTVKPSTIFSYRKKLKPINLIIGAIKVIDLDRRDILIMQRKLSENYSTNTTNYLLTMTRNILNNAMADRIINFNPCMSIKALKRTEPKARETIHRALTVQDQKIFFEYAKVSWYYELFAFMVSTGVRIGEAAALKWSDIDNCIHINGTVTQTDYKKFDVNSTKTEAGHRDIPLKDNVRQLLTQQKKRISDYMGIQYCRQDCRIFYPQLSDKLITPSMANHAIEAILKTIPEEIRMPYFTSHAFRDTFATRCIEQGMQPNTLKELLGHTKISITMDLYAQVLPDTKEEAMESIKINIG